MKLDGLSPHEESDRVWDKQRKETDQITPEMELAFSSTLYLSTGNRAVHKIKPYGSMFTTSHKPFSRKFSPCLATIASQPTQAVDFEVENKKYELLNAVQDTQRGLVATPDQRSSIEEALVDVEGYNRGAPIDLAKLDGTWRLQYTSAPDVLVLFEASSRLPFFQVGQIFQKFECGDQSRGGVIRNVVRWSIPNLLEEEEGAILLVSAKFDVVSLRNINLQFEEITVQNIKISEQLQALIAPALLPRSFISLQILQFLKSLKVQVPVTSPDPGRRSIGGLYYLSYLDSNMLLGRAVGGGGVFVFTKAQPLDL